MANTPYDPSQSDEWAQKMCAQRCAIWINRWEEQLWEIGISCSNATVLVPGDVTNCLHAAIILSSKKTQQQEMVHCGPSLEPRKMLPCCTNCARCEVCVKLWGE